MFFVCQQFWFFSAKSPLCWLTLAALSVCFLAFSFLFFFAYFLFCNPVTVLPPCRRTRPPYRRTRPRPARPHFGLHGTADGWRAQDMMTPNAPTSPRHCTCACRVAAPLTAALTASTRCFCRLTLLVRSLYLFFLLTPPFEVQFPYSSHSCRRTRGRPPAPTTAQHTQCDNGDRDTARGTVTTTTTPRSPTTLPTTPHVAR